MMRSLAAAAALLLTAPAAAQTMAPAVLTITPAADEAPPRLPTGATPGFVPPAHDEGGYRTPNRDLSPEEAVWHVRAALNVAAIGCRGAADGAIAAAYNALLDAERAPLAEAMSATQTRYHLRHGAAWQARFDDDMTRLYNYFAQPPVHDGFCAVADALLREAAAVTPATFAGFAAAALPRLEAPFTAFYADCDGYRDAVAAWRQRHAAANVAAGPAPVIAAVVPPVGAPAPVLAAVIASAAPVPVGPHPFRGPSGD